MQSRQRQNRLYVEGTAVSTQKERVSLVETYEFGETVDYGKAIEAQIWCENAVAGPEDDRVLQCFW